jgi:hypothetical protein
VDLDRNLFYVDHLSSLTFDLLQNLLGGRCKSVAHQTASDLPAREAHQIPEGRDHFSLVQVCTQLGGGAGTAAFPTCGTNTACFGGFNGGGSSRFGGGGGASGVRTVSRAQDGSLASRLIVAAGGGGSAGEALCGDSGPFLQGGTGGDAGSDGGSGQPCGSLAGGTGGKAGTQSEGGAGGSPGGLSGSLGQGGSGNSGNFVSGGGGGGLFGGGGGGNLTSGDGVRAPGGGGGGGSNLVPTGGTASIATTTGPSIIISYTVPKPAPTTKEQCKKGGWKNFSFPDQGTCITFVNENRR